MSNEDLFQMLADKDEEIERQKEDKEELQGYYDILNHQCIEQGLEIERLNNILEEFEEELEREINIKEEDLKIEHNRYIDINSTLRKMLERLKELKGVDKE